MTELRRTGLEKVFLVFSYFFPIEHGEPLLVQINAEYKLEFATHTLNNDH
jgi:hypothetical protein